MTEVVSKAKLRDIFDRILLFEGVSFDDVKYEKIGGLNNRNYKLTVGSDEYVWRIPGEGTEEYIDRAVDENAARITSDLGVNAKIEFYESGIGVQLSRFVPNATTLSPEGFRDLELVARAGSGFAKVHNCGKKFLTEFDPKQVAVEYLEVLRGKDARLPEGYQDVQKEAEVVREALAAKPLELVPSNNDPVPENFINTDERMYILDWEFAGNNDPMWDIGDLSVEAQFNEDQDRAIMEAYCGGDVPQSLYSRMVLQKSMVFLLWTLWGALQVANKNPLKPSDIHYPFDDFWQYTEDRFTRCQELMGASDFGFHLQAVKK